MKTEIRSLSKYRFLVKKKREAKLTYWKLTSVEIHL